MFEVACCVTGYRFDDRLPHPTGDVETFGAIAIQLGTPAFAGGCVHLAGVGFADDAGEIFRCDNGFVTGETIDFQLKILGHQLAHDDWATQPLRPAHVRRGMAKVRGRR